MSSTLIATFIIVGIWLLALMVSGILALVYASKHKSFKQVYDNFYKMYEKEKAGFELETVKLEYKLPKEEKAYFSSTQDVILYSEKEKSRFTKKFNKYLDEDDDDFYEIDAFLPKSMYSLTPKSYSKPIITGKIYITNKRIMIIGDKSVKEISLDIIKKVWMSTFLVGKDYKPGFYVQTNKLIYVLICNEPRFGLSINKLITEVEHVSK